MKWQLPTLIFAFILINGLSLIFCWEYHWLSIGRELVANLNALAMQEQRYALKEQNRTNEDENRKTLEKLNADLNDDGLALLPYSQLLPQLVKMRDTFKVHELTEDEFYVSEPVFFDTSSKTVVILDVSAVYYGVYENLCFMVDTLLGSSCHITELSISKKESRMKVSFSLYGIIE